MSMYMYLFMCVVCGVCLCRVAFLGSVGKVRGKLHRKFNRCFETANRECEGKMQRILKKRVDRCWKLVQKLRWTSFA